MGDLHLAIERLRQRDIGFAESSLIATAHAKLDYGTATGKTELHRSCNLRGRCEKIKKLVEHRLLEALSSPQPYVREWGRLVMQQKSLKEML